jgi:hypothetical protein
LKGNYQAAVGCVAWITSMQVLGALASLDAAAFMVQEKDNLSPGSFGLSPAPVPEADMVGGKSNPARHVDAPGRGGLIRRR